MKEIPAKTLVSKVANPDWWFGNDYNVNFYRGCNHGCIYCDSRSECYGVDNFDEVKVKKNALVLFENELSRKRKTGIIGIGAMSDSYNIFEKDMLITRGALQLIDKYGFGVSLTTKSASICRDIDLFKAIQKHSDVIVQVTITTANDELARIIEKRCSSTTERFQALKELNENGIYAGITLMPILPFINDDVANIESIVQMAHQYNIPFIVPWFGVTMRDIQKEHFFKEIDKHWPNLSQKYQKTYGDRYACDSLNLASLNTRFEELCEMYSIKYKMADVIARYKRKRNNNEQISLF